MSEELVTILLESPDTQLDKAMKPLIRKWSDPPKAVQVLEVLDNCIHGSLASGVVVIAIQALYEQACKREHVMHEDVAKLATWRNR